MSSQDTPKIQAAIRERTGTRYATRLREEGKLPAVIYGHQQDPVSVSVNAKELKDILHQNAHLIEVVQGSDTQACLVKDVQWDHLGSTIIHVDLTRVDLTDTVTVEIELVFTGEAIGLKEDNTIIEHPTTHIEIECRVSDIPDEITIDVSELNVGDSITVADLKLADGLTCTTNEESVLAVVHEVKEVEEEETEATEGDAEPEVIGREGGDDDNDDEKSDD